MGQCPSHRPPSPSIRRMPDHRNEQGQLEIEDARSDPSHLDPLAKSVVGRPFADRIGGQDDDKCFARRSSASAISANGMSIALSTPVEGWALWCPATSLSMRRFSATTMNYENWTFADACFQCATWCRHCGDVSLRQMTNELATYQYGQNSGNNQVCAAASAVPPVHCQPSTQTYASLRRLCAENARGQDSVLVKSRPSGKFRRVPDAEPLVRDAAGLTVIQAFARESTATELWTRTGSSR